MSSLNTRKIFNTFPLLVLVFSVVLPSVFATQIYSIGVYYIYNEPDYQPNWRSLIDEGMAYAIPRLNSLFQNRGVQWSYESIASIEINYDFYPDEWGNLPSGLYVTVPLIYQSTPSFKTEYLAHDLIILVFAGGFGGAYSYDYAGPIYSSEGMFQAESSTLTLIEHEILHTFGLRDHNWPHTRGYYGSCIMGALDLGQIELCPESQMEFDQGALEKTPFEELVPSSSDTSEPPEPLRPPTGESAKGGIKRLTLGGTVIIIVFLLGMFFWMKARSR